MFFNSVPSFRQFFFKSPRGRLKFSKEIHHTLVNCKRLQGLKAPFVLKKNQCCGTALISMRIRTLIRLCCHKTLDFDMKNILFVSLFVNFGQYTCPWIRVRISKTDPDPGEPHQCGSGSETMETDLLLFTRTKLEFYLCRYLVSSDPVPSWAYQCCGYGSWIRCLFDPWIRDPGLVKKFKIRIQDEHPGSYFR
jgi:hypothetical protein